MKGADMFCSQCGCSLADDARFCSTCGTPVHSDHAKRVEDGKGHVPSAAASHADTLSSPADSQKPTAAQAFSREGEAYRQSKKKPNRLPFVIGGALLVVLLVVGIAFGAGFAMLGGKPEPAADAQGGGTDKRSASGDPSALPDAADDDMSQQAVAGGDFSQVQSCSETCHTPMDPYPMTVDQVLGGQGTDKFGNAVSDTTGMLGVVHRAEGIDCLSCHQLDPEQTSEMESNWSTGNYVAPLYERSLEDLVGDAYLQRGGEPDDLCLNESCHNVTRGDLESATNDSAINPHDNRHGEISCSECHKSHRASVNYCTQCHDDASVPEGWLTMAEANKLEGVA